MTLERTEGEKDFEQEIEDLKREIYNDAYKDF